MLIWVKKVTSCNFKGLITGRSNCKGISVDYSYTKFMLGQHKKL